VSWKDGAVSFDERLPQIWLMLSVQVLN